MNILYIAFDANPAKGSEASVGWNIVFQSQFKNKVILLTSSDNQKDISSFLKNRPFPNLTIVYVDIPTIYKRLMTSYFFPLQLGPWQRRAFRKAKTIVSQTHIDIIHQITPVSFRNIGNYWKIKGPKFIVGPIGAGGRMPLVFSKYCGAFNLIEGFLNFLNFIKRPAAIAKLKHTDSILVVNKETFRYLACQRFAEKTNTMVEVGVTNTSEHRINIDSPKHAELHILLLGRLFYRKGHLFFLDVLKTLAPDCDYSCLIVGDGFEKNRIQKFIRRKGLEKKVKLLPAVSHAEIYKVFQWADVMAMPSFREATGTVLVESMSFGIPVIAFDMYGASEVITKDNGWLVPCSKSKKTCIHNFALAILECFSDRNIIYQKGDKALVDSKKYLWRAKMDVYQKIYDQTMAGNNQQKSVN